MLILRNFIEAPFLRANQSEEKECVTIYVNPPGGEGEGDWLLHLDAHGLLLLVHVGSLSKLDVANPNVAGGGELDSLLSAGNHHGLAKLRKITNLDRVVHVYTDIVIETLYMYERSRL